MTRRQIAERVAVGRLLSRLLRESADFRADYSSSDPDAPLPIVVALVDDTVGEVLAHFDSMRAERGALATREAEDTLTIIDVQHAHTPRHASELAERYEVHPGISIAMLLTAIKATPGESVHITVTHEYALEVAEGFQGEPALF